MAYYEGPSWNYLFYDEGKDFVDLKLLDGKIVSANLRIKRESKILRFLKEIFSARP